MLTKLVKLWGATNTPPRSLVEKNKTYDCNYTLTLTRLQELRDTAWHYAMKYRFDPVLGKAHEEYLQSLNTLLKECEL